MKAYPNTLTWLHSELPKLHRVLAVLSAKELNYEGPKYGFKTHISQYYTAM